MIKGPDIERDAHRDWRTVMEMFRESTRLDHARGVHVIAADGGREFRTWAQLLEGSLRVGAALERGGLGAGERVMIMMSTGHDFLTSFFGAMSIGAVPIPLAPPRAEHPNPFGSLLVLSRFARKVGVGVVLYDEALPVEQRPGVGPTSAFHTAASLSELLERVPLGASVPPLVATQRVAYIQPSSGTTGPVRAVALTHDNILSSVRAVGQALELTDTDIGVSWLPPDNIMSLVGFVMLSIYWGLDAVLMAPERFLARPHEWLRAIDQHRATITAAPDFAYHYCTRRARARDLEGLDLSSLRVAMSGGEPVRARHIKSFVQRFSPHGLDPDVFLPVYGLTEGTLAVTFAPLEDRLRVDAIDRRALEREGRATPLEGGRAPSPSRRMHLVSVGAPLPGVEIEILAEDRSECDERQLGEIAFRGPNVMAGYVPEGAHSEDEPGITRQDWGWVLTGDLGYLSEGRLYVVERAGEAPLDRWGRRLLPGEAELFINAVDGVRMGSAAVFCVGEGAEEHLVAVYEVQIGADADEIEREVRRQLKKHLDLTPDIIRALSPFSVPKTRDGKLRRNLTRRFYEEGRLERQERTGELDGVVRLLNRARSDVLRLGERVRQGVSRWLSRE